MRMASWWVQLALMVEMFKRFLSTGPGKVVIAVLAGLALMFVFVSLRSSLGESDAAAMSRHRMLVDSATGKPFKFDLVAGISFPVQAPSGGMTGYPAEECYWTADGHAKPDPDYVILNSTLGKNEPTFCPVCGRLVRGHNPPAVDGAKPPPTRQEYMASRMR